MAKRRFGLFSLCGLGLTAVMANAQTTLVSHPPKASCCQDVAPKSNCCQDSIILQPATPATAAPTTTPSTPTTPTTTADMAPAAADLDLGGGLALGESTVALALPGYIDNAMPMNRLRFRYDAFSNNPFPDRGEFFYPKCGCLADPRAGNLFDPGAKGPPLPESSVDAQEVEVMLETMIGSRASIFVETPWRFINPEQNANENGFGDMRFGAKYALIACNNTYLTAQIRVGVPTGQGRKGLGNELVSYEPALLLTKQLGCRSFLHAEFRGWIPTEGTDFAADILRYGVGYSYVAVSRCNFSATPVVELVGWSLLNGLKSNDVGIFDASGDTIVNGKVGVRFGFGEKVALGQHRSSLYLGYGHALTGEKWYEDVARAEYQINW